MRFSIYQLDNVKIIETCVDCNSFIGFPDKTAFQCISIRLPESLLERVKLIANKRDVPYQSLIKMYLAEKVREETRR
ncbi:MAG: hypothetical protein KBA61_07155 [Spirochaetes bacterium]|nr:hypothetical protein [Spirochaetota bacterium]